MDSTLLDQIRHLCRDRAAYEHLKAILVQQERVLQLSWEERYEKLVSEQVADTQASNVFSNILAREKALAQLADAIQRSPSLELVLQVAVHVAQKVLQVDRVAIFRRHPDGRGEFATDAIASGIISIADMPERQLLLARYMIESMQTEQSAQIVDSISSSSLSSHIITLLEQIGISSYAANKIYAGHEVWGALVAFHGSAYHSWSESDRTSLSLVTSQIGIAISLSNLRQQSQDLTAELHSLKMELDDLQQTVTDIINHEPKTTIVSPDNLVDESIITIFSLDDIGNSTDDVDDDLADNQSESVLLVNQVEQVLEQQVLEQPFVNKIDEFKEIKQNLDEDLENTSPLEEAIEEIDEEIINSDYIQISQNGLPRLFLLQDNANSASIESEKFNLEDSATITLAESEESEEIETDYLPVIESTESEMTVLEASELTGFDVEVDSPISSEISPDSLSSNLNQEEITLEVSEISTDESVVSESVAESLVLETLDLELPVEKSNAHPETSILEVQELVINDLQESEINSQVVEQTAIASELEFTDSAISESQSSYQDSNIVAEIFDQETVAQEALNQAAIAPDTMSNLVSDLDTVIPSSSEIEQNIVAPDQHTLEEQEDSDSQQKEVSELNLEIAKRDPVDDDRDPAIEPQFIETILSIAGNDQQGVSFLLNVIDAYIEDTPHLVQEIDKAIAVNDHSRLLQLLNTLRTSSEYIGALSLSSQCRQLESAVRANYVAIYACLSQVAIESQRATAALRIERSRYAE